MTYISGVDILSPDATMDISGVTGSTSGYKVRASMFSPVA